MTNPAPDIRRRRDLSPLVQHSAGTPALNKAPSRVGWPQENEACLTGGCPRLGQARFHGCPAAYEGGVARGLGGADRRRSRFSHAALAKVTPELPALVFQAVALELDRRRAHTVAPESSSVTGCCEAAA